MKTSKTNKDPQIAPASERHASAQAGARILAQGRFADNDSWSTGINNNDLVIGATGTGKTRGYVMPNIMQCNESMVIVDTKGNLRRRVAPYLASQGYHVANIDFTDMASSPLGYNPLDFVRRNDDGGVNEQDVVRVAHSLVPSRNRHDPFWDDAARQMATAAIAYVLESPYLDHASRNLASVIELLQVINTPQAARLFSELEQVEPESLAVRTFNVTKRYQQADKMYYSIAGILDVALLAASTSAAMRMFAADNRVEFRSMGKRKTALFVNVSDTDRSMDSIANLFYTQALQELCDSADNDYGDASCLDVPVRFIFDDFATGTLVPEFDSIVSVVRSRNISVSIIVQSLSQLGSLYGADKATTILNGCDHVLYLGGQDAQTADYIARRANIPSIQVLEMPVSKAVLCERGCPAQMVCRFDESMHPAYAEMTHLQTKNMLGAKRAHIRDGLSCAAPAHASDSPKERTIDNA